MFGIKFATVQKQGQNITAFVCENHTKNVFYNKIKSRSMGEIMLVKEIMNKNFVFCTEDATLEKVFELMTENRCDCVVVVESRAHFIPIGTITEHDICLQIVGNRRNPRGMYAVNVMNTKIVKATEKTELEKCRNLFQSKSAERLCIVDKDGRLCGTLKISEIEKAEEARPQVENMVNRKTVQIYNAPGVNRIF